MINLTLYRQGMKGSWKTLLVFAALFVMYFSIVTTMFDPELGSALDSFTALMPEIMSMVGMNAVSTTLIGFMSTYLYGFLMLVFPMIYSIITANKLIARHVERGSMTYLIASPVSRKKVAFTQMAILSSGIAILIGFCAILGIIIAEIQFPGQLDIERFLLLNLSTFCLQFMIGSICFLASCLFNDTKNSLAIGAGIPVACYVVQMIANMGGALENFKYATFFTLFRPEEIISGESGAFIGTAVLLTCAVIFYSIGIAIFNKRDLPL